MKKIDRIEIFKSYKKICYQVKAMQQSFFDEDFDSEEDEKFDAISIPTEIFSKTWFSLMVQNSVLSDHAIKLSEKLKHFLYHVSTNELIIISHLKIDFFGNLKHDYEKVNNAYSKLSKYFPEEAFKESFVINTDEINDFVEIFFWLERCDPSIPEYIFWFDKNERFCFYFCKYGNLHFIDFTSGELISEKEIENLGFIINDFDQFNQNSIEGRQIQL